MQPDDGLTVLEHGLSQLAALLDDLDPEVLGRSTPCAQWDVQQLATHIVASTGKFAGEVGAARSEREAVTLVLDQDFAAAFRRQSNRLLEAWRAHISSSEAELDWQCAELAVHTWDLATALGWRTDEFDSRFAVRGLATMRLLLTDEARPAAFDREQPAADAANAYERIAALAGRRI